MLLYLIKHSRPNLAKMTRALSKSNDGVNPAAYKELLCVIKYILDTKNLELKIKPTENSNKPWEIVCFGNGDYTGDPVRRRRKSVFILYVLGVPVSWLIKVTEKCITLQLRVVFIFI